MTTKDHLAQLAKGAVLLAILLPFVVGLTAAFIWAWGLTGLHPLLSLIVLAPITAWTMGRGL